jgi:flagellar biosynthesis regulator FlaF
MKHLHDAVTEYLDEQKTKIEALSWAHHVTPKQINDISSSSQMHYRTSCKSQLIHVLIHAKAKEINTGKSNDFYSMVSQSLSCIN